MGYRRHSSKITSARVSQLAHALLPKQKKKKTYRIKTFVKVTPAVLSHDIGLADSVDFCSSTMWPIESKTRGFLSLGGVVILCLKQFRRT